MLREFFCSGTRLQLGFAWGGMLIFLGHALFKAYLKYALNEWYSQFYDELQTAADTRRDAVAPLNGTGATAFEGADDEGSGGPSDVSSLAPGMLASKRIAVMDHLIDFAVLVAPSIVIHPLAKWIASAWRFAWRMALVRSYLAHYDATLPPVEGASQRIHEDTQRFETGVYNCGTMVLDSLLTVATFVPVLLEAGAKTHPAGIDWPPWLLTVAQSSASIGLCISAVVGSRLVALEMQNQRVEARFRTRLVLLEQAPETIFGHGGAGASACSSTLDPPQSESELRVGPGLWTVIWRPTPRGASPGRVGTHFRLLLADLWANYRRLFANFACFNLWIASYDQIMTIVPYLLVAPLLFADSPDERITLGTLVKVTNAFDKVFGALSVLTENWAAVNDFRSTVRRLAEFERATYARKRFDASLLREEDLPSEVLPNLPGAYTPEPPWVSASAGTVVNARMVEMTEPREEVEGAGGPEGAEEVDDTEKTEKTERSGVACSRSAAR